MCNVNFYSCYLKKTTHDRSVTMILLIAVHEFAHLVVR